MATIAIDFDHTLVNGKELIPGAKDAINALREAGHKIVIHTCNSPLWTQQVLRDNDIRYDHYWDDKGKPNCDIYVDDKGYHYQGDWATEKDIILKRLEGVDNSKWPVRHQTSTEIKKRAHIRT